MTRAYQEITYTAPLNEPLTSDAYLAPDEGNWRVVVFHGTPGNKILYTRFLRTAPRGLEVVVFSRPGFGKGHKGPVLDFDEQVAAAKPFFKDKNVITLGVSYGGELALKAALDYPETVKGVVTVAALIDEPHDYALQLEKIGGTPGVEDFMPDRWKRVRAEIAGRRDQIGPLMAKLESLAAPVEVMHGDFDALVPKSNADKLMATLPNAALDIVPGGTHYLELQYPRRVHAAVERAIRRAELQESETAGKTA